MSPVEYPPPLVGGRHDEHGPQDQTCALEGAMRHIRVLAVVAVVLTIAGLAAAPMAFALDAGTSMITVWLFDDRGTPTDTSDDVPTSSPVSVYGDDGDEQFPAYDSEALIAEGVATAEDPLVAPGLAAGWYWIVFDLLAGHADEESLRVELNTDPTLDCHVGDASTPGCVAGTGNTVVSIGLGPPEGVRRINARRDRRLRRSVMGRDVRGSAGTTATVDWTLGRTRPYTDPWKRPRKTVSSRTSWSPGRTGWSRSRPPDDFASHDPLLVPLNVDPTKSCVAGDLELWGDGPLCDDGQGYAQVFVLYRYPPSPGDPAVTAPPTDALDGSAAEPRGAVVPWLALTGLALTSLGVLLLTRPRRNRHA